jgi:hypothetical protein
VNANADPNPALKMNADPELGHTGTVKKLIIIKDKLNVQFQ